METQQKIKLIADRDFGGNFDLSIKFIKQNYTSVLKGLVYLIPLLMIAAFFVPNLFDIYYDLGRGINNSNNGSFSQDNPFEGISILGIIGAYILLLIVMFLIIVYTISYMALYQKSENGTVAVSEVWSKTFKVALPVLLGSILFGIAFCIGYIFCIIPGLIVAVYLGFYIYVYINEDLSIIDSFQRSFALVQNNFWVTLGFGMAFSMLIGMVSVIFILPMYAGMIASMLQVEFFANDIVFYICITILFCIYILLYPALYMAMGTLYYSHRAKLDGPDIESEIENIGNYSYEQESSYEK